MTVGERLKIARKAAKISGEELGSYVGVSRSQIANIEKGSSSLTHSNAIVISQRLGINLQWLLTGEGEMKSEALSNTKFVDESKGVDYVDLPFLPIPMRATFTEMVTNEHAYGNLEKFRVYSPPRELEGKTALVLEIDGDSMEPQLKHGSKVLAVEITQADWCYQAGRVYAIAFGHHFVCKRIKDNNMLVDGTLTLHSDNPNGGKITIPSGEIRSMWKILKVIDSPVE